MFRRIYRSRWFITFFACVVLCLLVWFFGPLLGVGQTHPLETEVARWITMVVIMLLWLITNLIREIGASRKEKQLTEEIAAPDPSIEASAEEVALLAERLTEAMKTLKNDKSRGKGQKRLSTLPWYMFIGPPGSGKTTALLNCGLNFPLSDTPTTAKSLQGVGGTRNCDWWFTDDAVMIDTAGRYTTQDSQASVDNAAWLGFLKLLKKHRKRQPINGVLVAISLSDLAVMSEDQRLTHARAVRRRVKELQDELGVRMPVYVLFTKADLIAGFIEFFDTISREEREQVWGVSFPLDRGREEGGAVAGFLPEFDLLLNRLNDRMLENVQKETDLQRRRLIYGFPQQLGSLREVANEFLTECFRPSRLESRALLRGVYFTSGTQYGNPIDRLMGTMASEFGLPRQAVTASSGGGRSYFLTRLIKEVVFGESGLVGLDPKVERRARIINYSAYGVAALVLLGLLSAWTSSYLGNKDLIAQVHASTTVYNGQFSEVSRRGAQDADLAPVVAPLNTLRGMRSGYNERESSVPITMTFGLYQGDKLGTAANEGYVRALNGLLLPRLIARVEGQMVTKLNNPDFLYQFLKVYLILGRQGPLDRELIMQWFAADLLASYPGEDETPLREALSAHADAMLRQPLTQLPLNQELVARARARLSAQPLAEYSYNRIMRSKRVLAVPEWTVAENGGPAAARVFQLRSRNPLDKGVPGIYTWTGYRAVFQPLLPTVTQDLAEDGWVLGRATRDVTAVLRDASRLRRDVMVLYLDDYTRRWDAMLADITVKPVANLTEALDQLSTLSGPASPLREVMLSIDSQTQLSRVAAADQMAAAAEARAARIGQRAAGFAQWEARSGLSFRQNEVINIMGELFGTDTGGKPVDPAKRVDEHFRTLHAFVTAPEGLVPPMEQAIAKMAQMYTSMSLVANAPNQGQAVLSQIAGGAGNASAAQQLQDSARGMPPPVAALVTAVATSSTQVLNQGAGQELANAWKSQVYPLCEAAFNRYPLVAGSAQDVPVDDFANLLAPGGMMDQFFAKYLASFVDKSAKPWKWAAADRIPAGLSPASLAEFERAAQIRDGLFGTSKEIMVRFQLVPVTLDAKLTQITIDLAGQSLTWNHGPPEPSNFAWPGSGGKTLIRVTMTPSSGGQAEILEKDGPWSLLRMLDAAKLTPSGQPDKFRITFTGGGGTAVFELNARSVNNPFTMAALRSFRCPAKL